MQQQSTTGKAVLVKVLPQSESTSARLYKLDPPLYGHEYVVSVSTIVDRLMVGIYPSDKDGHADWGEVLLSQPGTINHESALRAADYEVVL